MNKYIFDIKSKNFISNLSRFDDFTRVFYSNVRIFLDAHNLDFKNLRILYNALDYLVLPLDIKNLFLIFVTIKFKVFQ